MPGAINTQDNLDTDAFQSVCHAISQDAFNARFDPQDTIQVHVDASATALGAILMQIDSTGQQRVLEYASRILNETEL